MDKTETFKLKTPLAKYCYQDKTGNLCAVAQLAKWVDPNIVFSCDIESDGIIVNETLTKAAGSPRAHHSPNTIIDIIVEIEVANNISYSNPEKIQSECNTAIKIYGLTKG